MTLKSDKNDKGMQLGYVLFYVANPIKTAEFWNEAFGCAIKFTHESGQYVELATGATTLGFVSDDLMSSQAVKYRPNRASEGSPGAAVSFVTTSPESKFTKAAGCGATTVKALETKPWGQVSGLVSDINGILVEICSPIEHRP